jgi:peptide deformylase
MAIVRIRQLGDPILRRVSEPAANVRDAAEALINLRDTLHWFQWTNGFGRGISGVQIGDARRLIYLEFEGCAYCLINPELTAISADKFTLWDDCFSFPDLFVKVERAQSVKVRYLDETGAERGINANGAFSELLQHELDHLDGVLAIDRALDRNSFAAREEWLRQRAE